jgi:hypothetical protein
MLKGGFPPIYPIDYDNNIKSTDHIKRNFSSNNIIDINSILFNLLKKKKSSNLVSMLNLPENVESDENKNKNKNRNFKNQQLDDNTFINFINDLTNIKKISRPKKQAIQKKKSSKKN